MYPHVLRNTFSPRLPTPASTSPTINLQSLTCFNPVIIILPLHMTKPSKYVSPSSETLSIPSRCLNSSQVFLSFSVTPHICLTIILSALSSLCLSSTFIGQVSLPYIIEILTHALYILSFSLRDAPLAVSIGFSSLNFFQAHPTLTRNAAPAPPPQLSISPR